MNRSWGAALTQFAEATPAERGQGWNANNAIHRPCNVGRAFWLPALVGQGAWFGDAAPLARLLKEVMPRAPSFPLVSDSGDCLLRQLRNGDSYLSVGAMRPAVPRA